MALFGMADILPVAREMFPAQRKMLDAEQKTDSNGKKAVAER